MIQQDQRRFSRVPFDTSSVLELGGNRYPTHLIDVSLRGALLAPPDDRTPALGAPATVEIALEGSSEVIRMEGAVAHIEEGRLGIRCTSIDVESMGHLRRLIELNTGDSRQVERELSALL